MNTYSFLHDLSSSTYHYILFAFYTFFLQIATYNFVHAIIRVSMWCSRPCPESSCPPRLLPPRAWTTAKTLPTCCCWQPPISRGSWTPPSDTAFNFKVRPPRLFLLGSKGGGQSAHLALRAPFCWIGKTHQPGVGSAFVGREG